MPFLNRGVGGFPLCNRKRTNSGRAEASVGSWQVRKASAVWSRVSLTTEVFVCSQKQNHRSLCFLHSYTSHSKTPRGHLSSFQPSIHSIPMTGSFSLSLECHECHVSPPRGLCTCCPCCLGFPAPAMVHGGSFLLSRSQLRSRLSEVPSLTTTSEAAPPFPSLSVPSS